MKKREILILTIVACVYALCGQCAAASHLPKLQFRHYTIEMGLPSNCVRGIAQDEKGFVWFATDGGVTRFDGYDFKTYQLADASQRVHDDGFGMSVAAVGDKVWAVSDVHLYLYDEKGDKFDYQPIRIIDERGMKAVLRSITADADGNLWIVTNNKGVFRLAQGNDSQDVAKTYEFAETNGFVSSVYIDQRGDIWAVSSHKQGGVFKYDKQADSFYRFDLYNSKQKVSVLPTIIVDGGNGNMFIGDWAGNLYRFDPYHGEAERIDVQPNGRTLAHIHSLQPYGDGLLLIGSDTGLAMYDVNSREADLYQHFEWADASLSDQFVYPLVIDREGGLWIGTYYGGVNYVQPGLKLFEKYQPMRFANSVSGYVISALAEDQHGNLYIASDDGGLSRMSMADMTFTHIPIQGKTNPNLHSIMVDGNDLWVGSYGDGIFVIDTDTWSVKQNLMLGDKHSSYAIERDSKGRIWVAMEDVACRYNRPTGNLATLKNLGAQIGDIAEAPDGRVWFATEGQGLHCYDPVTGAWLKYEYSNNKGSLPHNHVNAIEFDDDGNLWVATVAGLAKYVPEEGVFEHYPEISHMGSIESLIIDNGVLWLTTRMGLVRFEPSTRVDVFTRTDGLSSSMFMPNSSLKASDGKIYIGTRAGFTAFLPEQVRPNPHIPTVAFTGLEINNESIDSDNPHLQGNINNLDKLQLHYDDRSFGIKFASLSYVNPDKNQYSYMLEGFDKDWQLVGNQNRAFYTNLPVGKYRLRVKASNGDNLWAEDPIVLPIEILPPWYFSWPMKALYVLLTIALIFIALRAYSIRSEQKHKIELMKIKNDKEIDLYQSKLSFFTMVAHEIRTPLSLIIGPLEKLMRSSGKLPQPVANDLSVIESNSQRLLFLVNQLLDFKKVEESGMSLKFRRCNVCQLLQGIAKRFVPAMEQKGIELSVDCQGAENLEADVDAEVFTKLVSNLLNNARKFTTDKVWLKLVDNADQETFTIIVRDNGLGISKSNQKKIFRPFYQVENENAPTQGGTGLGLSIVQSAAEGHQGSVRVESELGDGASFIATLPKHQAVVEAEPEADDSQQADATLAKEDANFRRKMMVVDDNEELCNFVANSFNDKYEVLMAENGEDALAMLAKHPDIDVVISDWMMPKLDGVGLCRAIRADKNLSHLPFVLLTAKTDNMSKVEGLNCGADAYIEKPFSVQVLEARVNNLLGMREMLKRKYSQTPLEPIETIAPHAVDNEFMSQLTRVIEDNFSNSDLDVDFLAAKMDMSRSSLYAKIKSLVDVTPNDLVRITRLKHAAKLLADGKLRVSEVCYMVGFNSSSYFAKCFQKQFGMTPTEFLAAKR